jgi:hypothetical protein
MCYRSFSIAGRLARSGWRVHLHSYRHAPCNWSGFDALTALHADIAFT